MSEDAPTYEAPKQKPEPKPSTLVARAVKIAREHGKGHFARLTGAATRADGFGSGDLNDRIVEAEREHKVRMASLRACRDLAEIVEQLGDDKVSVAQIVAAIEAAK